MMPSMSSSSFIARVRASAVRRKADGESGHPCGTPLATLNGKLLPPFASTYRIGLASEFVRDFAPFPSRAQGGVLAPPSRLGMRSSVVAGGWLRRLSV
eukprot:scaffold140738_cov31-Tisochrysis_lutea.AAC.1